jgi:hypothetical protein
VNVSACNTRPFVGALFVLCHVLQEVLDFQIDKQARLNQLPATVSLRQHQLALSDNTAGTEAAAAAAGSALQGRDLSSALVFSSNALERLKQRMQVRRVGGGGYIPCARCVHSDGLAACRAQKG